MERALRGGEVEGAVVKGQRRTIALDELRVRKRSGARQLEQLGDRIEPDDLSHERRERERQCARAGADVERALASSRFGELTHLFREPCGTGVLPSGDAFSRASETVSH
jgi:hypothetical protein